MLIVGEGDGDEAFFRYLCDVRQITGFQFDCAKGKDDFETFFRGLSGRTGISKLRALLVVGDNDEAPDANFSNIQKQLGKAKLPQPSNPLSRTTRGDIGYGIAVLMLPYPRIGNDSHGCLESLLLPAAEANLPSEVACIESFCNCVGNCGKHWSRTSRDKMRLRCLLSGSYPDDPNLGLRYALKPEHGLIPLANPIFNDIELLLTNFSSWMKDTKLPNWPDWIKAHQAETTG